ncbi:hypothetical protein BGZ60DRAFT_434570 [Tricladium varicosporioides]|nr:hypothetical protein BGZ60DRAFT_434570 [Hymenoscyphus varicosporioides]
MQLTTIFTILAVAASANAAALSSRANPKVNEYPKDNCVNHDGSNKPTWHHAPAMCKCVSMDKSTFSAYVTAPPGQRAVFFSDDKCQDRFREKKGGEDCVLLSQPERKIASIRMEGPFGCG